MASPLGDTRARGEEREVVTLLRRSLGVAALGMAGVVVTVGLLYITHERSEGWVRHSRELGRVAAQALSLATDRETGIRGYLLTGDSASLAPDMVALVPLDYALDTLSGLSMDNAAQHGRTVRIRQALERWERGYAGPVLAARARPRVASSTGSADLAGKALFDGVRSAFADFIDEENALYSKRVLKLGHGTTVKIYLPLFQGEVDAPASKPKSNGNGARGSETILLVEDDAALRALARKVLAAAGYTVLEAYDGENALSVCERHTGRIHLLATDVVMPGISGRALVERLVSHMPEIKVLFMSGYTDDDIVRRGIAGASATFLQKPFTPEVLARKVREALSGPARR
jgi:CheY-like chemotaxis protein/CHASE3 domain sensor protein